MDDAQDLALVLRLRQGDRRAFEQLVQCYERPMFNVAYRMLGNATEAADATQNVFLKVFEHLRGYDPKYRFFSWIYRIAVNESIDRLAQRRRGAVLANQDGDLAFASHERGPDELAGNDQMHDLIQASLMSLQEDYREVIVLRHFSECSYRQMAEILHIPEKTVKSRLHTARHLLREKLCTQGVKTA